MGWVVAALLFLSAAPQATNASLLPSRTIDLPTVLVENREPASFDLLELREDEAGTARVRPDAQPRSIFGLKRHVGLAVGYDNENLHGSVGWYVTVAEWGRWNFGIPSPAIGFGRYGTYDEKRKMVITTTDYSLVISLASIHYRVGHLQSLGMNLYVNVEQIFDVRANMPGSQIGVSLSRK
jgi:hypothetical protein